MERFIWEARWGTRTSEVLWCWTKPRWELLHAAVMNACDALDGARMVNSMIRADAATTPAG